MRLHLAILASALAAAGPADAATRNFTVTGFDRIRVDGPYRLVLATNVAPFAKATGTAAALDSVSLEVQGRTLVVRRNSSVAGAAPGRSHGPVTIAVGTHELSAAWVNGSGAVAIDRVRAQTFDLSVAGSGAADIGAVDVDKLIVSVSGTASIKLGGEAETAQVYVNGPSAVDASALAAKAATISAHGSATIRLTVTDTAKVDARGLGTIDLLGRPSCTIRPNTTAEVSGCR